ncbi:hypothetical protein Leryth_014896 [Lithospermum erythrorhizon]|nr:hypothetical protein Leryth_014896 [Lithospermum erythrorhizon]
MCVVSSSNHLWSSTLSYSSKCRTQFEVDQIHARLIKTKILENLLFATKLILNLLSSPHVLSIKFARYLFFSTPFFKSYRNRDDPFLWNSIIKTFSHGSDPESSFEVFVLMLEGGVLVDSYSFALMLKACSRVGIVSRGIQVHGLLVKCDFGGNLFVQNCLICMYVKSGCVELGRQVFDMMLERDSVSYNVMIDGYVKSQRVDLAREIFEVMPNEMRNLITWNAMIGGYVKVEDGFKLAWGLFEKMPKRDLVTWNLMLDCCVKSRKIELAHILFDRMPVKDVVSWAIMVDGHAKEGNVDLARSFFDQMVVRDVISCNAMMAGYVKNGRYREAVKVFYDMFSGRDFSYSPDSTSLVIVLSAVAQLGCIDEGVAIHCYIKENDFRVGGKLGVSLIYMYAKCGSPDNAMSVFDDIKEKSVDHWNAMIGGLAVHGLGCLAFDLFMKMMRQSIEPDGITYISVLNACAHSGMVKEGLICFEIMRRVHMLKPKLQHYGCMVDILSRAGHVEVATRFVQDMPIEPNDVVLRTLLSACSNHDNLSIGEPVAKRLIELHSQDPSSYVLLSNIYAQFGMWDYVRRIRSEMKDRDLKKVPGCSWIELDGTIHEFFVGDSYHREIEDISSTLCRSLTGNSKIAYFHL